MKRSTDRILTTHAGSLARPTGLLDTLKERENGRPYDADLLDRQVREAVADRVRQQVDNGIDVVTDGEMSKVSFLGYVKDRLGGFEPDTESGGMAPSWQKEVDEFPEYYADYFKKYSSTVTPLRRLVCRWARWAWRRFAVGIGCIVTFCCDLLVASDRAEWRLPQVALGILPARMRKRV